MTSMSYMKRVLKDAKESGIELENCHLLEEKIELTEIGSDGDRAYYRKNGTHYVPKVRLEDLLIG